MRTTWSIVLLALLLVGCSATTVPIQLPSPSVSPLRPVREPATLPLFKWEPEVMDAFRAGGVDIRLVGESNFERFLGDTREARVFLKKAGAGGVAAEVLFLTTPLGEIRMCASPSSSGFTRWTVTVDGNTLPGVAGSQTIYPLVGPRYFVLAWDTDSARALSSGLGLSAPRC